MTGRLVLFASVAVLLAGSFASAAAAPNPFDAWRQMFKPPERVDMNTI